MKRKTSRAAGWAAIIFLLNSGAQAAFVTSLAGGQLIPILDSGTRFTAEPVAVAAGITATSTNPDGSWIGPGPYSLGYNGLWSSAIGLIGVDIDNAGTDPYRVTLLFSAPVAGVGGMFNYSTFPLSGYSDATITAWSADATMLESYDISAMAPISTPGDLDQGEFRGILRASADIAAFSFESSSAALTDLTVASITAEVPEPSTILLVCLAMLMACGWLLRRDSQSRPRNRRSTIPNEILIPGGRCDAMYVRSDDRWPRVEMRRLRERGRSERH